MKSAREHPDTAEVVFPDRLAYVAIAFVFVTIGVPLIGALLS